MADRTISVRLSARVDSYIAAMEAAKASTTGFSTASQANLTRVGGQMQSFGRNATRYVTTPVLALGAGAVFMAQQFDTSMSRLVGLANVPAGEIDGLRDSVMSLAGETGRAPQELAEALYQAASAGLDSSQAMEAVELAARGAAAGMGTTTQIVDLIASATNAYGAANITAAEATDILTQTIREGRADPAELAQTLGRILPIASQMGITFAEVGGATAYLTNILGGADISTTALRDALVKLSAPGDAAKQALLEMGTSSAELKAAIDENGLMGALELLRAHGFEGNIEALHQLMPDMQGYSAISALLADESGTLAGTIDAVTDSTGALNSAYNTAADTGGFKMQQAITNIKIAMTEAGTVLLPIAAAIASKIGDLAGWFADLNPAVQGVVIALAGLAAVVGPIVFLVGTFIRNLVAIKAAMATLSISAGSAGLALLGIGAAIGVAVLAFSYFGSKNREVEERSREVGSALADQTGAVLDLADAARDATGPLDGLTLANSALGQALVNTGEDGEKIRQSFGALRLSIEDVVFWMDALQDPAARGSALEEMARQAGVAEPVIGVLAETIATTDENGDRLIQVLAKNLHDALGISMEDAFALAAELRPVAEAMEEVDDQSQKFDGQAVTREFLQIAAGAPGAANGLIMMAEAQTGLSRNGADTRTVMAALLDIIEALPPEAEAAARAALGLAGSQTDLAAAAEEAGSAVEGAAGKFSGLTDIGDAVDLVFKGIESGGDKVGVAGGKFDAFAASVLGLDNIFKSVKGSDDFVNGVGEMAEVSDDATDSFRDLEDAGNDLMAVFDQMTAPADRLRDTAMDVHATFQDVLTGLEDTADAGIDMADAFDITTEAGRSNMDSFEAARDAIYAHGAAMVANGASAAEAAADIAYNTGNLRENMLAAGVSEDAVDALMTAYQLLPSDVATAIRLYGVEETNARIDRYNSQLGSIPAERATAIKAAIQEGDLAEADRLLDLVTTKTRTAYIGVRGPGATVASTFNAKGNPTAAIGAYVRSAGTWDLHPNEAVFPLSNPRRMRELTADPRIGEPLWAALAGNLMPVPAYSPAGYQSQSAGSSSSLTIEGGIHVADVKDLPAAGDFVKEMAWRMKAGVGVRTP